MEPIKLYAALEDAAWLLHDQAAIVFIAGKLHEPVTPDNVAARTEYEVAWAMLKNGEDIIRAEQAELRKNPAVKLAAIKIRIQAEGRDGEDRRTATTDKDWDWD